MNRGRLLRLALQTLVIGLIFAYLARALFANWQELARYHFTIRRGTFALATALLAAGYLYWFVLWHLLTVRMRVALPAGRAFAAYFYSMLWKYVPGKVWMLAARFYFYRKEGRDPAVVSVAVVLEGFYHVAGQAALVLILSPFSAAALPGAVRALAPVVLAVGLVLLHPRLLERILNAGLRLARRPPVRVPLSYGDLLLFLFLYLTEYALLGLAFYFLADSLLPLPVARIPDLALASAAGGVVSMLAIFTPSGLGVREGVFFLAVRPILPEAYAAILSLLTRVWTTLMEVVLIGGTFLAALAMGPRDIIPPRSAIKSSSPESGT